MILFPLQLLNQPLCPRGHPRLDLQLTMAVRVVLINTFQTSSSYKNMGLFTGCWLECDKYWLMVRPHQRPLRCPKRRDIFSLCTAGFLHEVGTPAVYALWKPLCRLGWDAVLPCQDLRGFMRHLELHLGPLSSLQTSGFLPNSVPY